jgi:type IV secretory pathway VirB10-like protein
MNYVGLAKSLRLLAGSALLLCAGASHAQHAWIDAKGQRHYSDLPPPPSTPAAKILKAPRPRSLVVADLQAPAPVVAEEKKPKGPPTLAEREADFKKRTSEQVERDRKASEEAKREADVAENCNVARRAKAQMESGVRVATADASGASSVMTDEQRAQELARTNKIVDGCS